MSPHESSQRPPFTFEVRIDVRIATRITVTTEEMSIR